MRMTYRDGRSSEDDLFDQPDDMQRAYIARCMNLDPGASDWPMDAINRLLAIRRLDGRREFYRELGLMMSPDFRS